MGFIEFQNMEGCGFKMNKKVLLCANHSVVEPLGLLHLSKIAEEEGWTPKISLVKNYDFNKLDNLVDEFNPEIIGFTLYTGNHVQTFSYLDNLKKRKSNIGIVLGGPHPTYFPAESKKHSDYVVISEGFNMFRRILNKDVSPGILALEKQERFPVPSRENFYKDYP